MKAPNLLEMHARKLSGRPDAWRVWLWESLPKEAKYGEARTHFQLTGSVPSTVLFKSGPRKGQPNPKFHTDVATVIISEAEYAAFEDAWEKETGLCKRCGDTGMEPGQYSTSAGQEWRPCTRCKRVQANPEGQE